MPASRGARAVIVRRSNGEFLHIGRGRRYGKDSVLAALERMAESPEGTQGLRESLSLHLTRAQVAALDDQGVIDTLAAGVASGSLTLVLERPLRPRASPIQAEPLPDPEPQPEPKPEEPHWIEIELRSEDDDQPVPHARYVVELPTGEIVEGYLDENGKARLEGIPAGECKVTFPDHAEPGEGEVEVEEAEEPTPAPPPPVREECQVTRMVVECGHDRDRKKKLTLPAPAGVRSPLTVLEVLGAWSGKGDTIKATITGKRCAQHAGEALVVTRPDGRRLTFAESTASFDAFYSASAVGGALLLWPWNKDPVEYQLGPGACHGASGLGATVRVYPDYEASLTLEMALDAEKRSGEALLKARKAGKVERRGRPAHTDWSLGFEGEIKYGTVSKKLGIEVEGKLKSLSTINRYVKRAIDTFCEIVRKYIGLDLELELPNLSLAYAGKFKELPGQLRVGHEWSIKFEADPLFGVTLKTDILDLLLKSARNVPALSVLSAFLLKARAWAKAEGITLEVIFAIGGRLGFELEAKKSTENKRVQIASKAVALKIVASLTAKAEAARSVRWLMSFRAGAEIEGHTGVLLGLGLESDDVGLSAKLEVTLLALELEYSIYASGKFEWTESEGTATTGGKTTFWGDTPLWEPGGYVMKYEETAGGEA